jgi:hypothetical protein
MSRTHQFVIQESRHHAISLIGDRFRDVVYDLFGTEHWPFPTYSLTDRSGSAPGIEFGQSISSWPPRIYRINQRSTKLPNFGSDGNKLAELSQYAQDLIMLIGILKEIKNHKYRVAVTPAGVRQLVDGG